MKLCPAPMASAFLHASCSSCGSVPDRRTRHLPEASQECEPELDSWHRADQRFVNVLDRLDEMRLAENEVGGVRLVDLHDDELHNSHRRWLAAGVRNRPAMDTMKPILEGRVLGSALQRATQHAPACGALQPIAVSAVVDYTDAPSKVLSYEKLGSPRERRAPVMDWSDDHTFS